MNSAEGNQDPSILACCAWNRVSLYDWVIDRRGDFWSVCNHLEYRFYHTVQSKRNAEACSSQVYSIFLDWSLRDCKPIFLTTFAWNRMSAPLVGEGRGVGGAYSSRAIDSHFSYQYLLAYLE